jgi:hypothetical protein
VTASPQVGSAGQAIDPRSIRSRSTTSLLEQQVMHGHYVHSFNECIELLSIAHPMCLYA